MDYFLGIDLGGTKVAAGVVDDSGRLLSRVREATAAARGGDGILPSLARLGRNALAEAGVPAVSGVGVALPGPTDRQRVALIAAPTIPEIENVSLAEPLVAAFDAPVSGDNDANAAALAEALFGAGRGAAVVAYFTISTGIGGGVVSGGRLFRGAHGTAGELGHQVVEREGEPCHCGASGCLETVASGPAIARRARAMVARHPASLLADREWRGGRPWDTHLLAAAARAGDERALHLWEEVGEVLGIAVANVINLLDPDCVVLGGGVMNAADLLMPSLRHSAAERAMPRLERAVWIAPAALGDDAGLIGAAALAWEGKPV